MFPEQSRDTIQRKGQQIRQSVLWELLTPPTPDMTQQREIRQVLFQGLRIHCVGKMSFMIHLIALFCRHC